VTGWAVSTGLRRWSLALLALVAACAATTVRADEFRPAYLQLTQVDAETWDVLWKIPAVDEGTVFRLSPSFPADTRIVLPMRSAFSTGTIVQRWRIQVPGGLQDKPIAFPGLSANRIDVLVRLVRADGSEQVVRVLPAQTEVIVEGSPGPFEVAKTYTALGIHHILVGVDHLLFVLSLLLIVVAGRLVATITAFTVAHSLTLGAATLGWVSIPGPPVEATIALSIMFLAMEILRVREGRVSLTARRPWLVAFTFGLLHGLGFAGALAEVGLPATSIPLALLCFNIGVEIGQLMFVAAVLLAMWLGRGLLRRLGASPPDWVGKATPYAIGGIAGFWLIERVMGW
jgi:hypothetical protein